MFSTKKRAFKNWAGNFEIRRQIWMLQFCKNTLNIDFKWEERKMHICRYITVYWAWYKADYCHFYQCHCNLLANQFHCRLIIYTPRCLFQFYFALFERWKMHAILMQTFLFLSCRKVSKRCISWNDDWMRDPINGKKLLIL